jgi:hypothetical protein
MVMKPKQCSAWLALQNLKAAVNISGMTRLGLVLVAFGLPRGTRKNRRGIKD